jgi:diketogulonate reductase-like aldo/keto reductase
MSTAPETIHVELNDGRAMPQLGFGVFQIPPADTAAAVGHALRVGYRHVDTAAAYRNEAQVGEAIRSSGLDREAVFVTTKLWNSDQGRDAARRALEASLDRLGFDAVDLYLIHWPAPARDRYLETWETLIELQRDGLARSIGVSNFEVDHLQRIIDATGVVPAVNQIELHPRLQQRELRGFHDEHGINTTAWSPLAQGGVLGDPPIVRLAGTYGKTAAQVILRWHLDLGNIVIPKSVTPKRIEENFGIFDFRLDEDAMRVMAQLDAGERIGPDPRTFTG